MASKTDKIIVYYDGACPSCLKDRCNYEKWSGAGAKDIVWLDINGREEELRRSGIDPYTALLELHIVDPKQGVLSELDAYILLMRRVPRLRPLAWFIALPLIRPVLSRLYHWLVVRRLSHAGRL